MGHRQRHPVRHLRHRGRARLRNGAGERRSRAPGERGRQGDRRLVRRLRRARARGIRSRGRPRRRPQRDRRGRLPPRGPAGLAARLRGRGIDELAARFPDRPPARDPASAGGDEAKGRADRHGHRLRLPLRQGRRGGRGRRRARRRHRGHGRARVRRHHPGGHGRDGDHGGRGSPRAAHAGLDRRPAVRLIRALQRACDRERAAVRQGGGLRRRQARARRRLRGAGAGNRRLGDSGDGPRRADTAIRQRAGRLQDSGADRRVGGADRARRGRAPGGGLLRDRLRSGARRGRGRPDAAHRGAGDRHRRRDLQRTGRCSCSTTCWASAPGRTARGS